MTDRIDTLLALVYGPDLAGPAAARLREMLARFPQRPAARPSGAPFSERDVALITYGDSLRRPEEPPLRTLERFARERLTGAVSAIHILPFFPYTSDDGFSITDFYRVNPALGDWDDVRRIGQHFDLMVDAVFNHMSAQSDWFRAFLAGDPAFAGMFRVESPEADLSTITRPRTTPLLTPFQTARGEVVHVWTTFSADQVDLDYRDPQTLLRMLAVLLFYVTQGARYIRLDAIAYLWKVAGTSGIHLPETHAIIQLMRAVLDEVAPDVIVITETNVPHAENIAYFGDGANEAQMVYNFALPPLLFHTLLSGDASRLRDWVNALRVPSERTTFFNFTASHDGIGVRPVEGILSQAEMDALIAHTEACGGRVSYKRNADGSQSPYELNIAYVDAVTDPAEPQAVQARRFLVSQAIMLALAGVPAIYVHSLLGSRSDIPGMERSGHNRTINREKLDVAAVDDALADPDSFRAQVFGAYRAMLLRRKQIAAFHPGAAQAALDLGQPGVFALLRTPEDGGRVLAIHNVTGQPRPVDLSAWAAAPLSDLLSGERIDPRFLLAPYQVRWLELSDQ